MPMPLERALSWGVPPSLGDLLQCKTKKPHRKHFICDLLQFLFQAVGKFPFPKMIFFSCSRKWGGDTVRGLFQLLWKGFICMLKFCMSWSSGCKELPKETEGEGSLYLQKPWAGVSEQPLPLDMQPVPSSPCISIISTAKPLQCCGGTRVSLEAAVWGFLAVPGGCWIPICSPICFNTFAFLPSAYGKFEGI